MVRSTNSTRRGPSLSDSPGTPLAGCWWLEHWELWCAGLWGWEVTVPGCMGVAYGCCRTTDWLDANWRGSSPVGLDFWLGRLVWQEAKLPATPLSIAFTSRETGGTMAQHGMSVTIDTAEMQGSSTECVLWWLAPAAARACLVAQDWCCWIQAFSVFWSWGCTEVWAAGGREEVADTLWEGKDVIVVVAAVVLPLGLIDDEADVPDSGEIKRLMRSRTDCGPRFS